MNINLSEYINKSFDKNDFETIVNNSKNFYYNDSTVDLKQNVAITVYGMVRTLMHYNMKLLLDCLIKNCRFNKCQPYFIFVLELKSEYPMLHNSIQYNNENEIKKYLDKLNCKYKMILLNNCNVKDHAKFIKNQILKSIIEQKYCHEEFLIMNQHVKSLIVYDLIMIIEEEEKIVFDCAFRLRTDCISIWLLDNKNISKLLKVNDRIVFINDLFAFVPKPMIETYYLSMLFYLKISRIWFDKSNLDEYKFINDLINISEGVVINALYQPVFYILLNNTPCAADGTQLLSFDLGLNNKLCNEKYGFCPKDIDITIIRYDKTLKNLVLHGKSFNDFKNTKYCF